MNRKLIVTILVLVCLLLGAGQRAGRVFADGGAGDDDGAPEEPMSQADLEAASLEEGANPQTELDGTASEETVSRADAEAARLENEDEESALEDQ
jgi:hypothetical protein